MPREMSENTTQNLHRDKVDRVWLLDVGVPPTTRRRYTIGGSLGSRDFGENIERITNYQQEIEFPEGSGNIYSPVAFQMPDIDQDSGPTVQQFNITLTHVSRKFAKWLNEHEGLNDQLIEARLVSPHFLNSGDEIMLQHFVIETSSFNNQTATFKIKSFLNQFNLKLTRKVTRTVFPHIPRARTIIS